MSDKSCLTCPSYLKPDEATRFFGKSIGAPMCARFGKVLGEAELLPLAEKMIADNKAEDCSGYGKKRPVEGPEYLETNVAAPMVGAVSEEDATPDEKAAVTTCHNCMFYVPDHEVNKEYGWSAGLCGKTGRLLLGNRLRKEAEACDVKKYGQWDRDKMPMENVVLIPIYKTARDYDPSPLGRWKKERAAGTMVDPVDYESDLPVSDDERELGIRAWRRIDDPHGTGNFVHIPVFDLDRFEEDELAKVPRTGDDEHPENYIDADNYVYSVAVQLMELDETPALWGEAGVGKTELARHLAWLMCAPFDRMNFSKSTEIDDVAGKMLYTPDKGTFFQPGRLVRRWEKPGVILLDEPNAGPDDVWQFIRPITDNSKQLVLDMDNGRRVPRHDFAFLLMAMNPAWDFRNTGVAELADADTNRLAHVFMDLPPREVEKTILLTRCEADGWTPDKDVIEGVLDVAEQIRALSNDGSLPVTWGIRPNIKVIRQMKWFDKPTAYRRAVTDFLDPQVGKMILDFVTAKWVD